MPPNKNLCFVGAVSPRSTDGTGLTTNWAASHIWRNPALEFHNDSTFCFSGFSSWGQLCLVRLVTKKQSAEDVARGRALAQHNRPWVQPSSTEKKKVWKLREPSILSEPRGLWVLGPTAARGIMQATLAILVWMASSVSSSSYTSSTLPDITNEDFIQQCVQIHNQHRAQVNPTARNMMYMVSARTVFWAHIHQRQPACAKLGVNSG